MAELGHADLTALLAVNDQTHQRFAGPAADDVYGADAVRKAALSCWNWALVGHIGAGVRVGGALGDVDAVVYPNELYDYVAQRNADQEIFVHGQITMLTGEPQTGMEQIEALRRDYQNGTNDRGVTRDRVARLAASLNGLTISDAPTRYELCMYYRKDEANPSFEHWWLVVHDDVPGGAVAEFDYSGVTVEHFTALVDILAYRGGQLYLHRNDAAFQRDYGVLRYFLSGLHQRQVDAISAMIAYRANHADAGNTLDTRQIADWTQRHAQVALN